MNVKRAILSALIAVALHGAFAAEESGDPVVTLVPFEPAASECYDIADKFRRPKELVAPKIIYPALKRGEPGVGAVVVLVRLDGRGFPKSLSVLSSTSEPFTHAAIEGLKKARWDVPPQRAKEGVWFYYNLAFDLR